MNFMLSLLMTLAVVLNAYATVVLVRSPRYERRQKWLQCGLIWLLPVFGAILVWSLAHDAKAPMFSTDFSSSGAGVGDGVIGSDSCSSNDGGGADSCGGGDGGGGGD